jgi:hypothetical protein
VQTPQDLDGFYRGDPLYLEGHTFAEAFGAAQFLLHRLLEIVGQITEDEQG